MSNPILSVFDLNQLARDLLEGAFSTVWVEGEISNLAKPSSGHLYFSLKDSKAQIRCALFKMRGRQLSFSPESGQQVIVRGRVSLYCERGDYQLLVDSMEEAGDGALQRAFDALKKRLSAEGLFAPEHKKPLPAFPKTIGVITSATGAAIHDILSVLQRRCPSIKIIIYPTLVQGNLAAGQIIKALQLANKRQECEVLILARGGGSLEDLWPFNEETVARAIYASTIPIVSGVGHEVDFTIADFVADVRAPTPSASAELISPHIADYLQKLEQLGLTLRRSIKQLLINYQQQLNHLQKRLRHPGQKLQEQSQQVDRLEQRLQQALFNLLKHKQQQFAGLVRALEAVSPLATLERGYAIVTAQGKVLQQANQLKPGDKITARLQEGSLDCVVEKIHVR